MLRLATFILICSSILFSNEAGVMIQNGSRGSEFGEFENTYYFKWALSF